MTPKNSLTAKFFPLKRVLKNKGRGGGGVNEGAVWGGGAVLSSFIFLTLDCVSYNYCLSAVNGHHRLQFYWYGLVRAQCIAL